MDALAILEAVALALTAVLSFAAAGTYDALCRRESKAPGSATG